jgi:hypothetical protein
MESFRIVECPPPYTSWSDVLAEIPERCDLSAFRRELKASQELSEISSALITPQGYGLGQIKINEQLVPY